MLRERRSEALEVACTKRDGPPSSRAPGRIGEANEFVALCVSEELNDRREALLARTLRHGQLFHHLGLAPRGCGLGHATDDRARNRANVSPIVSGVRSAARGSLWLRTLLKLPELRCLTCGPLPRTKPSGMISPIRERANAKEG
jgi:hypothetical protein